MGFQHLSGTTTHRGELTRILGEAAQEVGKPLSLTRLYNDPAIVSLHETSNFAVPCSNGYYWPAGGGDAIKFARNDQTFEIRF